MCKFLKSRPYSKTNSVFSEKRKAKVGVYAVWGSVR